MRDLRMRPEIVETPVTADQAEAAARLALASVSLSVAQGIRSGRLDVAMITPMIERMQEIAKPIPEMRDHLEAMRVAWNGEKMADVDVASDLRMISRRMDPVKGDRPGLSVLKGPEGPRPQFPIDTGVER